MTHGIGMMLSTLALMGGLSAGCRRNAPTAATPPAEVTATAGQRVPVIVDASGYHPATINAPAGAGLILVFNRVTDEGCGQQLVFPGLNLRRDLPLNQPVEVPVTATAAGAISFTCGMGMYRGAVVAR